MSDAQQNHTTWTAYLSDTAGNIAVGNILCLNAAGNRYVLSSAANRALQTLGSVGIALTAGDDDNPAVELQFCGMAPDSVTGLGAGAAGFVRVSTTGVLERVVTPADDDEIVGKCDEDGNALLNFATGIVLASDLAALDDCVDLSDYCTGDGTTDDAPGVRAAILAAVAAGHYKICVPPAAVSYHLASSFKHDRYTAVLVNEPVTFVGREGARYGDTGCLFTVAAGLTAFQCRTGLASEGGAGCDGGAFIGIEVEHSGYSSVSARTPSMSVSVGQLLKPNTAIQIGVNDTGGNKHLYEVIKSGTLSSSSESTAWAAEPHTPDRTTPWLAGDTAYQGTYVRSTDLTAAHQSVFFRKTTAGTSTLPSEPSWDYTPGNTTNDANGVSWFCESDPNILVDGTAVMRVVARHSFFVIGKMRLSDCRSTDAQNAGFFVEGNASTPILASDSHGTIVEDCIAQLSINGSGNKGIGFYFRGGELKDVRVRGCHAQGGAGTTLGNTALATDGTQHQHGFLDGSTFGITISDCSADECAGYDCWISGTSSEGCAQNFHSNQGRCRPDSSSCFLNMQQGLFWSILGGPNSHSTTGTSTSKNGCVNAYEISPNGLWYAGINAAGQTFNWWKDLVDSGTVGIWPLSGWGYYAWASASYPAWAIATRQVATHSNAPAGREAGEMLLPYGADWGASSDSIGIFSNRAEYEGSTTFNRRGGYRRVGDVIMRPDRAGPGENYADVVTVAGYMGHIWTAATAYLAKVNPGSSSAHLASIVTNVAGTHSFKCTTAGTSHPTTEPTWDTTTNNTTNDNGIVWTCMGPVPTTEERWGPVGGVDIEEVSSATGTQNDLTTFNGDDEEIDHYHFEQAGTLTITGLTGGRPGREITISSSGPSVVIVLKPLNGGSASGNQFYTPNDGDYTFSYGVVTIIYDNTFSAWRVKQAPGLWGDDVSVAVAGSNVALSATQSNADRLTLTGTPGATRTITWDASAVPPSGKVHFVDVINTTDATQTLSIGGGTTYTINYYQGANDDPPTTGSRYRVMLAITSSGIFARDLWSHSP